MTKGTQWTKVRVFKDKNVFVDYPVKVAYEYDSVYNTDRHCYDIHNSIDLIEWPENISSEDLDSIKQYLSDLMEQIIDLHKEDQWDTDDYWDQRLENN